MVRVAVLAQTGEITGVVTDPSGAVVPVAKVSITLRSQSAESRIQTFSTVSNSKGQFTFHSLLVGTYDVQVEAQFFTFVERQVEVVASQVTRLNLWLTVERACSEAKGKNIELTDDDKAEIVKQVLESELKRMSLGQPLILSTKNIKAEWIPKLPKSQLEVLSPFRIGLRSIQGDFHFSYFSEFEVHGDCVTLTLIGDLTGGCNMCGSGATYVFHKVSGKWSGKFFRGWIS
jgi:hypothetical protein